jgi:hypothetical protein
VSLTVVLPDQSSGAVSLHCAPHLDRSRDSNASRTGGGHQGYAHQRRGPSAPRFQYRGELGALPDAPVAAESGATRRAAACHWRGPGARWLRPEALPALGAAPLDHEPAAPRSHADQKAVRPSSATIVGLERSLHCLWNPLRKIEPPMLSTIVPIVKTRPPSEAIRGGWRVMVVSSRGANFLPDTEPCVSGSLVDPVTLF